MRVLTCPEYLNDDEYDDRIPTLFVAGGITGAPQWQDRFLSMLSGTRGIAFNPRRPEFDVREQDVARTQIIWEATYLAYANGVSFWFPKEVLCPITLYESYIKHVFIGVHPDYQRRTDVEIQTELALPEVEIVHSLEALAGQVISWANGPVDDDYD
jgi:hypothetical protein